MFLALPATDATSGCLITARRNGPDEQDQIEPHRPAPDIEAVQCQAGRIAAEAPSKLGETREAGARSQALIRVRSIVCQLFPCEGAWANKAHVTVQDAEKLREPVET